MRRIWWVVCLCCLCLSSVGCFLDDLRRDKPGISRTGVSSRARQIEDDVAWESL